MINLLKKSMLLGVGALSLTKEKAEKLVRELEEKGEVTTDEARQFVDELVEKGEQERNALTEAVQRELDRLQKAMGLVTKPELRSVEERISRIEARYGVNPAKFNDNPNINQEITGE